MNYFAAKKPMQQWATNLLIFLIFASLSPIFSQNVEHYTIKKINSKITIDGSLNEDVWSLAKPTKDFVVLGESQKAKTAAFAKILWDEDYLYVGFYCQDLNVWATYQNRDDPLYKEDVVEVYIDPDGDGKKYIEVEVNPLNTIFDLWLTKPWAAGGQGMTDWTMAGLLTATSVDGTVADGSDQDTAWMCEMALPFSEMKFAAATKNFPPLENDKWRFNMYRFDRSFTSGKIGEATGWSQTQGGQHEPDRFGVVLFDGLIADSVQSNQINNSVDNFVLHQNYPNPFNQTTSIEFTVPVSCTANLKIYDIAGHEIETLFDDYKDAGEYRVKWTAHGLSSGVYFYRLNAGNFSETKKLILRK